MLKTVSSITNAIGALNYVGTWNASTNSPALASGVGTKGNYYQVSVAGSTSIDGISNWGVGDVIAFNGLTWQRIEGGADLNGVNLTATGTASIGTTDTAIFNQLTQTNVNGTGITKMFSGSGDVTITTDLKVGRGLGGAICLIRGFNGSTGGCFSRAYLLAIEIPGGTGGLNAVLISSAGGLAEAFTFGVSGSDIQITAASTGGGGWFVSFFGL